MATERTDVVIVGAGAAGGILAGDDCLAFRGGPAQHRIDQFLIGPLAGIGGQIDGGIDAATAVEAVAAGASILVAGSAIFNTDDPEAATRELRSSANAAARA